ncbi:MAG: threonylcarbamoyl-AMP synthase [Oscillospiraceae bacterium]|nr:threonylcarbamoyl-AMP synthase [Oscillospiraceae bacterium]
MNTRLLSAQDPADIALAAGLIRAGELVGIPTETVYGLGANGLDEQAVLRIFEAKGRPQDNPLILHIAEPRDMEAICHDIPAAAWTLAERFWPGPLTMVLPVRPLVPKRTTAGLDTVAVRCPRTPATRELIRLAGVPVAAPSANRSGKPSTTTAEHVLHDMDGRIAAILDGGPCAVGVESTIVDLTGPRPRLLRPGGVTPEQLRAVLGELEVDRAVLGSISNDTVVRAPGMKYKHYAPAAQVIIVSGSSEAAAAYVRRRFRPGDAVLCFQEELPLYEGCDPTAYGRGDAAETLSAGLFAALRALDRPEIRTIFARCPEGGGVAYAVGNRLKKAAGFHIVDAEAEP